MPSRVPCLIITAVPVDWQRTHPNPGYVWIATVSKTNKTKMEEETMNPIELGTHTSRFREMLGLVILLAISIILLIIAGWWMR